MIYITYSIIYFNPLFWYPEEGIFYLRGGDAYWQVLMKGRFLKGLSFKT